MEYGLLDQKSDDSQNRLTIIMNLYVTFRFLLTLLGWMVAALVSLPAQAQSTPSASLQSLVDDTQFQINLGYRYNLPELERRHEQIDKTIAAWKASSRSDADNRQLADWLRGAIRASMPGSAEPLPPLPEFAPPSERPRKTPHDQRVEAVRKKAAASEAEVADVPQSEPTIQTSPADQDGIAVVADFWESHPASSELPAELLEGDPFGDDPLPDDGDLSE